MTNYDKVQAVQRMQDYIEGHIGEPITLNDLSKAADYSPSHSLRAFKELTGFTPFDYIRLFRLTRGAKRLRTGNVRIADVASECAFDTHEGFTRAFSKEFGLSPESYKDDPVPVRYFIPYSVLIRYLVKNKGEDDMENEQGDTIEAIRTRLENKGNGNAGKRQTIFTYVAERSRRKAVIKRGVKAEDYFAYCGEAGCDVLGILESVKGALYEPAGYWLPRKLIREGTSKYVMGAEVPFDFKGTVPDGFEVIDLEPCKVMVFQGEPYGDEDFEEAIAGVWEAIDRFDPAVRGFEWADADAPRFQLSPVGRRGYIEARPIREIKK